MEEYFFVSIFCLFLSQCTFLSQCGFLSQYWDIHSFFIRFLSQFSFELSFFVFVSIFFFCLNSLFACCNYFACAIATANDEKHALPDFQFHEVCVCVWVGGILHYTIINFNRNSSRGFRLNRFFKAICRSYCRSSSLSPSEKFCALRDGGIGVFQK